jgi:sugar/nucleoside kinase (ribokinase family)
MGKVLGIGNALVDITTILKDDSLLQKFDLPKGSMQLVDKSRSGLIRSETAKLPGKMASGGSAANTVHGLAKLGTGSAYIGSIGKDENGDFFEKDMKAAGVETFLVRRDSATGTAIAFITSDSERTFATYLGAAVDLNADDLDPDYFNGFEILYLEGYQINNKPLVEKACTIARNKGMKIVLDLASFNVVEAYLEDFRDICGKYIDILFANEEEAKVFTGKGIGEALEAISGICEIAVIKAGSEGSWIRRGNEIIKISTGKVKVIDTTGAGDLYAAGFLSGYCNGASLEICGQYGAIAAGKVIEILGAKIDEKEWPGIRKTFSEIRP